MWDVEVGVGVNIYFDVCLESLGGFVVLCVNDVCVYMFLFRWYFIVIGGFFDVDG